MRAVLGSSAAFLSLWMWLVSPEQPAPTLAAYREAMKAVADAFFVIAICLAIATAMVPLMRKVGAPPAPSADAH